MRIAIDLDKTIFDCDSVLYNIISSLMSSKKGANRLSYSIVDINQTYGDSFLSVLIKELNHKYYNQIENAIENIKQWHLDGNEIVLLSSRPNLKVLKKMVISWLEDFDVPFTMLVIGCSNKALFCQKYKIGVLIDDSKHNCLNAKKLGVNAIHFRGSKKNKTQNDFFEDGIKSLSTWEEIGLCVRQIIENNNLDSNDKK